MTRETYAVVTEAAVGQHFPFWGSRALRWKDVVKAELPPNGFVGLHGGGTHVSFNAAHWAGLPWLREVVRRRVPADVIDARDHRWG